MDQYTCWAKSKNACSNLLLLLLVVVVVVLLLLLVDDDDDAGASSCMDLARRCSHSVMCRNSFCKGENKESNR